MTAPERILAWQNAAGQGIYAQHSDGFERDFSETHFTRTDIHQAALDRIAELEESLMVMASDNPCTCMEGYRGRGLHDPACQAYMFGDDARDALGLPLACQAVLAKGDG